MVEERAARQFSCAKKPQKSPWAESNAECFVHFFCTLSTHCFDHRVLILGTTCGCLLCLFSPHVSKLAKDLWPQHLNTELTLRHLKLPKLKRRRFSADVKHLLTFLLSSAASSLFWSSSRDNSLLGGEDSGWGRLFSRECSFCFRMTSKDWPDIRLFTPFTSRSDGARIAVSAASTRHKFRTCLSCALTSSKTKRYSTVCYMDMS